MRESRRRIEDTTEPKNKKKDGKQFFCFRTKTAHIEQLLFDPIGPFSYVLSHIVKFPAFFPCLIPYTVISTYLSVYKEREGGKEVAQFLS